MIRTTSHHVQTILIWAVISFALGTMIGAVLNDNMVLAFWAATAAISQATVWIVLGTVQTQKRTIDSLTEALTKLRRI